MGALGTTLLAGIITPAAIAASVFLTQQQYEVEPLALLLQEHGDKRIVYVNLGYVDSKVIGTSWSVELRDVLGAATSAFSSMAADVAPSAEWNVSKFDWVAGRLLNVSADYSYRVQGGVILGGQRQDVVSDPGEPIRFNVAGSPIELVALEAGFQALIQVPAADGDWTIREWKARIEAEDGDPGSVRSGQGPVRDVRLGPVRGVDRALGFRTDDAGFLYRFPTASSIELKSVSVKIPPGVAGCTGSTPCSLSAKFGIGVALRPITEFNADGVLSGDGFDLPVSFGERQMVLLPAPSKQRASPVEVVKVRMHDINIQWRTQVDARIFAWATITDPSTLADDGGPKQVKKHIDLVEFSLPGVEGATENAEGPVFDIPLVSPFAIIGG